MANFIITTANSLHEGSLTSDLFYFNTARGVSMQGFAGDDTFTAGTANLTATDALIGAAGGNDTINLGQGFNTNQGSVYGGAGNDVISALSFSAVDSTIQGGGGNDTVRFDSASFNRGTLGLNGGADVVTAGGDSGGIALNSALLALGGGGDIFSANSADVIGGTVNGGGGADDIDINDGTISTANINGDVLGDNTYFGNDTIEVSANFISGGATINGGYGNDTISAVAGTTETAFFNGNVGTDSITVDQISTGAASAFVGGGAGNDTINVGIDAGYSAFGTVAGGGGADGITFSAAGAGGGVTGGFILGGAGSDTINFNGGISGASTILFDGAEDSNFSAIDTVSSDVDNVTGANFQLFDVSNVNTASSVFAEDKAGVFTGVGGAGLVTFTSTYGGDVSAMISALDGQADAGEFTLFTKQGSNDTYLFLAGDTRGDLQDDLVVKVNNITGNFTDVAVQGTTLINVGFAS